MEVEVKKLLVIGALVLAACSSKDKVSFSTAEDSRMTVKDNVSILANQFRSEMKLNGYDLIVRGDSTVSVSCPQGDGWASVDLVDRRIEPNMTLKLKCSTVSAGIGCMLDSEFKTKAYAAEDGVCNNDLPFPLPKISK
jgi:hypothetical protein